MLSILIQLNPSYLLGIMEKDSLVSWRHEGGREQGVGASRKTGHGGGQEVSRRELGGKGRHAACLGGISPGTETGVESEVV